MGVYCKPSAQMSLWPMAETDWWAEERAAQERGFRTIAGIDEAGRGPLAGPVVAACVVLPPEADLPGVRDSKEMTPKQREHAYEHICRIGSVAIGVVSAAEIDAMSIVRATHQAMRHALNALPTRPDIALIDGRPVRPFPIPQLALVKGDTRSISVAAASVVAKVTRDRMMEEFDREFPQYGFAEHKGYPTPMHLARLAEHGPCILHRRSFAPVAQAYAAQRLMSPSGCVERPDLTLVEDARRALGESGETVAAAHLRVLGWRILRERYRCPGGEVDLIAEDNGTLVFVEVKTRRGGPFGGPAEAVDVRKRARLLAAAESYLASEHGFDQVCRFDVVEVVFSRDERARVRHIRNAFMADE